MGAEVLMRVILDTNVLLSALLSICPPPVPPSRALRGETHETRST